MLHVERCSDYFVAELSIEMSHRRIAFHFSERESFLFRNAERIARMNVSFDSVFLPDVKSPQNFCQNERVNGLQNT